MDNKLDGTGRTLLSGAPALMVRRGLPAACADGLPAACPCPALSACPQPARMGSAPRGWGRHLRPTAGDHRKPEPPSGEEGSPKTTSAEEPNPGRGSEILSFSGFALTFFSQVSFLLAGHFGSCFLTAFYGKKFVITLEIREFM